MKFNKWTVALASVGLVSLASTSQAEETPSMVQTTLASTTLSGYVDTSAQWNFGTGNANNPPYKFGGASKADGFNLNVVQLRIEKPLDESSWAAGYRVDLWAGPDANVLGTQSFFGGGTHASSSDFAVRQAYVALRMPFENGIDWKVGVFDSIIGYESVESPNNPNFTRSYGHSLEPQTHTGILASYRFNDVFSASAGVANTTYSGINSRAQLGSVGTGDNAYAESYKTYMASVAITTPDNMSFLSGSTFYAGVVNGFDNSVLGTGAGMPTLNVYVGGTLATPVTGLRFGIAWDLLKVDTQFDGDTVDATAYSVAGYGSYQISEKLSAHLRVEYVDATVDQSPTITGHAKVLATTGTLQYDLWKNVLSRLELRWDHSASGDDLFGGTEPGAPSLKNAWMLAANVVYKF
jgi:hypothetical protein